MQRQVTIHLRIAALNWCHLQQLLQHSAGFLSAAVASSVLGGAFSCGWPLFELELWLDCTLHFVSLVGCLLCKLSP